MSAAAIDAGDAGAGAGGDAGGDAGTDAGTDAGADGGGGAATDAGAGAGPLDDRLAAADGYAAFESAAHALGCDEVLQRRWQPAQALPLHAHPFDLQVRVAEGEVWLTAGGRTDHLVAGQGFSLAADLPHAERYGAAGAVFWVGRRHRAG